MARNLHLRQTKTKIDQLSKSVTASAGLIQKASPKIGGGFAEIVWSLLARICSNLQRELGAASLGCG
jgi:hypothetical protein